MNATVVQFKIECDKNGALLVMDRKQDTVIMDWQSAKELGRGMLMAVPHLLKVVPPWDLAATLWEQGQIKLAANKGKVAMLTEWTDRIRYKSVEAFRLTAMALLKVAQDAELQARDVHIVYDEKGFIRQIHDLRAGTVQGVA